jgi:hypothetical protein
MHARLDDMRRRCGASRVVPLTALSLSEGELRLPTAQTPALVGNLPRGVVNANSPRLPAQPLINDNDRSSATRSAYTVVAVNPP